MKDSLLINLMTKKIFNPVYKKNLEILNKVAVVREL